MSTNESGPACSMTLPLAFVTGCCSLLLFPPYSVVVSASIFLAAKLLRCPNDTRFLFTSVNSWSPH